MQKRVLKTLYNRRKKIEEKEAEIENFINNPLMFFNELQYDREVIPDLLREVDESLLLEYQRWQYPMVIKAVVDNFDIYPFSLSWEDDVFPSPIYFIRDGYRVASIEPYKSRFKLLAHPDINSSLEDYESVAKRRIKTWEKLAELNAKKSNPFINEDDSMLNTIKVSMRRRKIEEGLEKEIKQVTNDLNNLMEEENTHYRNIEKLSRKANIDNHDVEKVFHRLKYPLNLRLIDGYQMSFIQVEERLGLLIKSAEDRVEELNNLIHSTEQY